MNRRILFMFTFLVLCGNARGDEIAYVVTRGTYLTSMIPLERPTVIDGTLAFFGRIAVKKGDSVFFQGQIGTRTHGFEILVRTEYGQEGWIDARHILPRGFLPLPSSITERLWVPSHYQQFLIGYPKEALFEHEQDWRDHYHRIWDSLDGPWWEFAGGDRFVIRDNLIHVFTYVAEFIYFATINQRQDGADSILYVICVAQGDLTPQNHLIARFDVSGTYRLTLRIDGDYMDVFVDDDAEPITTLIGVDDYFATAIADFFRRGTTVDPSNIIWPRRADGGMDFPPPDGVTFRANRATAITPAEPEITEHPETHVYATEDIDVEAIHYSQPASVIEGGNNANSMPPWALISIIGAALPTAGGLALFAIKRKNA